jgi:hypothetical protein
MALEALLITVFASCALAVDTARPTRAITPRQVLTISPSPDQTYEYRPQIMAKKAAAFNLG